MLKDDGLILCLDDLPPTPAQQPEGPASGPEPVDKLLAKNEDLQREVDRLTSQFDNYRLAVQQTLDQRWEAEPGVASAAPGVVIESDYFASYAHSGNYHHPALSILPPDIHS